MQTIPDDVPEPPRVNIPSSPPQLDAPSFSTPTNSALERNNQLNGDVAKEIPAANSGLPNTNGIQTGREAVQLSDSPTVPKKATEVGALAAERWCALLTMIPARRGGLQCSVIKCR